MVREKPPSSRFTPIAYSLGLAIIFSATVLNLCLYKLPPKHLHALPSVLVDTYEQGGNLGVTLMLAGVGVIIMALGYVSSILCGHTTRTGGHATLESAVEVPTYVDPRVDIPSPATASSGTMILDTAKYLGKKPSALPGSAVFGENKT